MELFLSQFHLLRPFWLLALVPTAVLFIFLLKRKLASARWQGIVDEKLMPHVLDQMPSEQSRWPLWFVLLAWLLAIIALAGPTWEKLPQPVQKKDDALVIVLDMSLSMAAQDVSPDRATRARQKVIDILKQRQEGLTALVVYAGDAYTVTPLTDDAETIINLVPALSPFIMPAMGSRPDKALALANKLVFDSGLSRANLLLITDGIQHKDIARIQRALGTNSEYLSVLTVGTEDGAPIAMQGQGFKRDKQGNIVLPKLDIALIQQLSHQLNIPWHQMSFDDADWQYLLSDSFGQFESDLGPNLGPNLEPSSNTKQGVRSGLNKAQNETQNRAQTEFDLWADQGYWLIIIVMFIAAFSFRRGWLLSVVFVVGLQPENSMANWLDNAWQTQDQQAQQLFAENPEKAAELFEDPNWKASSYYRAEDYSQALEHFTRDFEASPEQQSTSLYNRGNALAQTGQLEEAITAYQEALELNPALKDAVFNKRLVEKLLEQQQQESEQQDSEQQDSEQQDSDQQDSDQQDSEQQDSDQQDSDQQDSEQQDSEQQDSEQQGSEQQDSEQQDSDQQDSEQQDSDQQDSEQLEAEQQEAEQQETEQQEAEQINDDLSREERQALEQWLNRIPDDPGGLLKRKFMYQYKQRDHQDEGEVSW